MPRFYAALKKAGVLPAAAPERLRVLRLDGCRSIEQIVDAYAIECRPVRDLLVEYLSERAPDLDHTSLRSVARNLCRLFWRDLGTAPPWHRLTPAGTDGRPGMEGTAGIHPRRRPSTGASPRELPQRTGVRTGLLRGHRTL